jgi:hypothetical protein
MSDFITRAATHATRTRLDAAPVQPRIVTPFVGRCSVADASSFGAYAIGMPSFDDQGVPGVRAGSPPV